MANPEYAQMQRRGNDYIALFSLSFERFYDVILVLHHQHPEIDFSLAQSMEKATELYHKSFLSSTHDELEAITDDFKLQFRLELKSRLYEHYLNGLRIVEKLKHNRMCNTTRIKAACKIIGGGFLAPVTGGYSLIASGFGIFEGLKAANACDTSGIPLHLA